MQDLRGQRRNDATTMRPYLPWRLYLLVVAKKQQVSGLQRHKNRLSQDILHKVSGKLLGVQAGTLRGHQDEEEQGL